MQNEEEQEENKKNTNKKRKTSYKQIDGTLKKFDEEKIIIEINEKEITILKKDISNVKLKYYW